MDSKLVVEQMSGRWKIKHEDMRRLALEAREVAADISAGGGSVRFTWIPRAENKAADALANAAWTARPSRAASTATRRPATGDGDDGAAAAAADLAAGTSPADPVGGLPTSAGPPGWCWCGTGSPTSPWRAARRSRWRGPRLNALGRQQVAAAARAVRAFLGDGPVRVVSSSLAAAYRPGLPSPRRWGSELETDEDWDEQAFGDWDGKSVGRAGRALPGRAGPAARGRRLRPGRWGEPPTTWPSACSRRSSAPAAATAGGRGDAPQADHGRARPRARHPARPDLAAGHLAGVAHRGRDVVRRRRRGAVRQRHQSSSLIRAGRRSSR